MEVYEEFIGNKQAFKSVEQSILDNVPVLIHGPPGIGKTYSVHLIAKKHGFKVVEYNASDQRTKTILEKVLSDVQRPSLFKKIYLFDEVDGMENYNMLLKIIEKSVYPIAMTANDIYKIPSNIRSSLERKVRVIRYYPPSKKDIVSLAKKLFGSSVNYSVVSDDVRNTLITLMCGSEPRIVEEPLSDVVTDIFKGRSFPLSQRYWYENNLWIWVLDNITKFYDGVELFEAMNILVDAAFYNKPYLLKSLSVSHSMKTPTYPYFLKRKKAISNK